MEARADQEGLKGGATSIPRALLGAVAVIGTYYVFVTYAATIGFGPNGMDNFAEDAAWFDTLTRRYLGEDWAPFIDIAALTGAIASCIGIHNSTLRLLYTLGRNGNLPKALAKVHPTRRSPWVAASVQASFSVVLGLIFGYLVFGDPATTYGYFGGLGTLAVLFVYIFINASVFLYLLRQERENFPVVRHALIPLVAAAAGLPIYGLIYPLPDPPYNLWPYLIALWAVIGLGILFLSLADGRNWSRRWDAFSDAGVDEPDTTQEEVRRREDRDVAEGQMRRKTIE